MVTKSTLFYENNDMEASVDLQWVSEVEYDDGLATGAPVKGGKVLRLSRRLWPTTGDRFLRWVELETYRIDFGSRGSGPGMARSAGWMV